MAFQPYFPCAIMCLAGQISKNSQENPKQTSKMPFKKTAKKNANKLPANPTEAQ